MVGVRIWIHLIIEVRKVLLVIYICWFTILFGIDKVVIEGIEGQEILRDAIGAHLLERLEVTQCTLVIW